MIIIHDCLLEATQDVINSYILGKVLYCLQNGGTYQVTQIARELKYKKYQPITKRLEKLQADGWFFFCGTQSQDARGKKYDTTLFTPTNKLLDLKEQWEKETKSYKRKKATQKKKEA